MVKQTEERKDMNAELLLLFPIIINKTITQYRFFSFHQLYWVLSGEGVFIVGNCIFNDVNFNINLHIRQLLVFLVCLIFLKYNRILALWYMHQIKWIYLYCLYLGFYTLFLLENGQYCDFKHNEFKLSNTLHFLKEQNMVSNKLTQ